MSLVGRRVYLSARRQVVIVRAALPCPRDPAFVRLVVEDEFGEVFNHRLPARSLAA